MSDQRDDSEASDCTKEKLVRISTDMLKEDNLESMFDDFADQPKGDLGNILSTLEILQRQFEGFASVQYEVKCMVQDIRFGGRMCKPKASKRAVPLSDTRGRERAMTAPNLKNVLKIPNGSPESLVAQASQVKELRTSSKKSGQTRASSKRVGQTADFHPLAPSMPDANALPQVSSQCPLAASGRQESRDGHDSDTPATKASNRRHSTRSCYSLQSKKTIQLVEKVQGGLLDGEEQDDWAEAFALRLNVPAREMRSLLENGTESAATGCPKSGETSPICVRSRNHLLFRNEPMLRALKALALVGIFFAPLQFSVEPTCERKSDLDLATTLKIMHLMISIVYVVIAMNYYWNNLNVSPSRQRLAVHMLLDGVTLSAVVGEIVHLAETPRGAPSAAQYLCMIHHVKLWRICSACNTQSSSFAWQVIELVIVFIYMGHAAACLAVRLVLVERAAGMNTWADAFLLTDESRSCTELYSAGLYFTSYTMTGVGYGDIVPANALEHILCVLYMILTQFVAAKIFAEITWITQTLRHSKAQYHALLSQTAAVLNSMGAPSRLRQRVRAYQDFVEQQRERKSQDCLQDLSRPLHEELKLIVYYDLVLKAPFLQEQPPYMVRAIIMRLTDLVYLPCEVIVRKGDVGTELFFLRQGNAGVFTSTAIPQWSDNEVHLLKSGNYFGEIALLTGMARQSWVVARTYCSCSVLTKQVMDELMNEHPEGVTGLVKAFQSALGLTPTTTWKSFFARLCREFANEGEVYKYCCAGSTASGCITWQRWELLAELLEISALDAKLLWVDMEPNDVSGAVKFQPFMETLKASAGQEWIASSPYHSKTGESRVAEDRDDSSSNDSMARGVSLQ